LKHCTVPTSLKKRELCWIKKVRGPDSVRSSCQRPVDFAQPLQNLSRSLGILWMPVWKNVREASGVTTDSIYFTED
jgi:hypothetical protein